MWREPHRLVFIDETAVPTKLTRLRRAARWRFEMERKDRVQVAEHVLRDALDQFRLALAESALKAADSVNGQHTPETRANVPSFPLDNYHSRVAELDKARAIKIFELLNVARAHDRAIRKAGVVAWMSALDDGRYYGQGFAELFFKAEKTSNLFTPLGPDCRSMTLPILTDDDNRLHDICRGKLPEDLD